MPHWLLPLCFTLAAVTLAAAVWLRVPEAGAADALVPLALLVPAVLLGGHRLGRRRQRMRRALQRASDELDGERWHDAVRERREAPLDAPAAFGALAGGMETALGESERRWQALADLSADWYWKCDRQQRFSWLSGAAPQALGLDESALLGRRIDRIGGFHAPEAGWAALHRRMTRLEAFRDVEFRVSVPGQASRCIALSGRPRRNVQGTVIGYEGVGRDVTERRVALERASASEQRWSAMAQLAADWYWQTDAEHRLLPMGAEQQRRIGADLAERLEGRTRWDVHRDALTPEQWAGHRADLDARRPFRSLQLELDAGGGRCLWISISGLPRVDAGGRFLGYHGVGRDITARQQAQALLLRHNEAPCGEENSAPVSQRPTAEQAS